MKLKKTIALLLSSIMVMTMAIPVNMAFADETNPIVLNVGADKEYKTINDALNKIKDGSISMPTSESERIFINVDAGVYEEQVIFTENMKYITIRQTPDTDGLVKLSWYYCTGYAYSNCDLSGNYNPDIDWSNAGTWYGYDDVDESGNVIANTQEDFTPHTIGEKLNYGTISYYDKNNVAHTNVKAREYLGSSFQLDSMATLIVKNGASNITIEDLHIVNSVPVMVTQGEKDAHITPCANDDPKWKKPARDNLSICDEDTEEIPVTDINETTKYNAGESAYIVKSYNYNERGHAISLNGDRIICKNIYARGNQDSVYISTGRIYFEDCNLIGGTDYIYGNAATVFNKCKLGFEGMSDRKYGGPITATNTDADNPYGYLFYNCEVYNVRENAGTTNFGRPWGSDAQVTFYNTTIDDNGMTGKSNFVLDSAGWTDMSVNKDQARFYEYGTKNKSGATVDLSKRVVNTISPIGSILDDWQVLEFNPRNYFKARRYSNNKLGFDDNWDPMGFAEKLTRVDEQLNSAKVVVPEGEETVISLPQSTDENVEFKWLSSSTNAILSDDGKSIIVVRPAIGEEPIETSITLYAKDKLTNSGDKKVIPVIINPTTDKTNIFNIPVTITTSISIAENSDYQIIITKDGALIKSQKIIMPAGKTSISDKILNIPANEKGIEYNVKIVPTSDEFSVVTPVDATTTIKGISGADVPLDIIANKIVDKTVETKAEFKEGTSSFANYDLISLAKNNGAGSEIEKSDIITVDFDFDVSSALKNATSYIDLTSKTPTSKCNTGSENSRYSLFRIYKGWNQFDMVDCATGFSGTSNTDDQWLNISGKFDYKTTSHISVTINYKTETISAKATGSGSSQKIKEYTFASFPTDYEKGKLNLAVYPSGIDTFSIKNINVTYKAVLSEDKALSVTAEVKDGSTVVNLNNITKGVVVANKYDNGKLVETKTLEINGENIVFDNFEANSVFVWHSLFDMKPITKAFVIK